MLHRTSVSVDVAVLERTFRQRRPWPGLALIDGLDAVMAAVDEDILAPITRSERQRSSFFWTRSQRDSRITPAGDVGPAPLGGGRGS